MTIGLAFLAVFLVIFLVPVAVYGAFSRVTGLQPPGNAPFRFLAGVALSKLGTAAAFVGIFAMAADALAPRLALYVGLWWGMLVLGEIGQILGPNYSLQEALAGLLSETIYLPLSGLVLAFLLVP